MLFAVPRKRVGPTLFDVGKGNVAAVADAVNDEGVGDLALDFRTVKQVIGGAVGPALDVLLTRGLFHGDAEKIAGAVAVAHNFFANGFGIESGVVKLAAFEPQAEQIAAIAFRAQVAEVRLQNAEDVRFSAV